MARIPVRAHWNVEVFNAKPRLKTVSRFRRGEGYRHAIYGKKPVRHVEIWTRIFEVEIKITKVGKGNWKLRGDWDSEDSSSPDLAKVVAAARKKVMASVAEHLVQATRALEWAKKDVEAVKSVRFDPPATNKSDDGWHRWRDRKNRDETREAGKRCRFLRNNRTSFLTRRCLSR